MSTLINQAFEFGKLVGLMAFLAVFCAFSIFEIAMFIRFLIKVWKEHGNELKR